LTQETRKRTASDLLTLEEEYSNQLSWRDDEDKLTFIVCTSPTSGTDNEAPTVIRAREDDRASVMVGDVNLFLNEAPEDDPTNTGISPRTRLMGEINIMIARRELRRMGLGRSALQSFLMYVWSNRTLVVKELEAAKGIDYNLVGFQAKIDADNEASIGLFESLGFKRTSSEPNYFGEVELTLPLGEEPPFLLPRETTILEYV
jgi:RimJ/RimL family protein N-acetyltransferase